MNSGKIIRERRNQNSKSTKLVTLEHSSGSSVVTFLQGGITPVKIATI